MDSVNTYLVHQPNWLTTNNIREREQQLIMNQDQFISLFQCPAFSLLFSSVTVQLFSCVCSSVQFFPCVFQCPVSIFFLRFSFACSNVQRFQFRIGDSGVSINSSPGSLHSSSPGDNNWFAWLLPWEQSGPHKASSSVCKQCVATSVQAVCSIVNIVHNVCALFLQYTALCIRVYTICKKYPHFQCKAYIIRVQCNEM